MFTTLKPAHYSSAGEHDVNRERIKKKPRRSETHRAHTSAAHGAQQRFSDVKTNQEEMKQYHQDRSKNVANFFCEIQTRVHEPSVCRQGRDAGSHSVLGVRRDEPLASY